MALISLPRLVILVLLSKCRMHGSWDAKALLRYRVEALRRRVYFPQSTSLLLALLIDPLMVVIIYFSINVIVLLIID